MMPSHSCDVPGRKPGTSTKVSTGTLKASQVRTNRAAFSDASMSSVPANCIGLLATTPMLRPSIRPKPQTIEDGFDDVLHVVRRVVAVRDDRVELDQRVLRQRIDALEDRRLLEVVRREE